MRTYWNHDFVAKSKRSMIRMIEYRAPDSRIIGVMEDMRRSLLLDDKNRIRSAIITYFLKNHMLASFFTLRLCKAENSRVQIMLMASDKEKNAKVQSWVSIIDPCTTFVRLIRVPIPAARKKRKLVCVSRSNWSCRSPMLPRNNKNGSATKILCLPKTIQQRYNYPKAVGLSIEEQK